MKYGLIGEKLGHSYSKPIHNALGNSEYELKEIPQIELEDFMGQRKFCGINVTIPYKQRVIPFCTLDEASHKIGSVNTIVNKNGTLYGYNTDYYGFLCMTNRAGIDFSGKKVLILGSGGTAKTAIAVVIDAGATSVTLMSRNLDSQKTSFSKLSEATRAVQTATYEELANFSDVDILVNTTPVGMYPNNGKSPIDLAAFTKLSGVVDVVYNPLRTQLVLDARKQGIPTATGLYMLVAQAVFAHAYFFDRSDLSPQGENAQKVIEDIYVQTKNQYSNIVLVGMPGCGKSTIAKLLAKHLSLAFVDIDTLIEEQHSLSCSDLITQKGELVFRNAESEATAEQTKKTGFVIATGGGNILREQNRDCLAQNGFIIFIERDIADLATKGRPLSAGGAEKIAKLYQERYPIYSSCCDLKVSVEAKPELTVKKILELLP